MVSQEHLGKGVKPDHPEGGRYSMRLILPITNNKAVKKLKFPYKYLMIIVYSLSIICLAAVIIYRRPDAVTMPQFWAEDGTFWFAESYNKGFLIPFLMPHTGYLQTYSRLFAAISQTFPLIFAPLLFNFGAIIAQMLPGIIILIRYKKYIPSFGLRLLLVTFYAFLPNTSEIYINLTNAQWFLAFAALLVTIGPPAKTLPAYIFDCLVVLFSGLNGPFGILLVPVSLWRFWREKNTWTKTIAVCIVSTAFVQCISLLVTSMAGQARVVRLPTGSPSLLFEIVYKQIIWGSLGGKMGMDWIIQRTQYYQQFFVVTGIMGIMSVFYALYKGPWQIRVVVLYGLIILTTSLLAPPAGPNNSGETWASLTYSYGVRYWLIPMLSFLTAVVFGLRRRNHFIMRGISIFFIGSMLFLAYKIDRDAMHIQYQPYPNLRYESYITSFSKVKKGTVYKFPINPKGWSVTLIKK